MEMRFKPRASDSLATGASCPMFHYSEAEFQFCPEDKALCQHQVTQLDSLVGRQPVWNC